MKRFPGLSLHIALLCLLAGCGGAATGPAPQPVLLQAAPESAQHLAALPQDGLQPWEELDAMGHAVPRARSLSSITVNTIFTPGVERFLAAGDVAANGEALRLNGGAGNDNAYAIYRIGLQDEQPAVVAIDANLLGSGSSYYVGVSNYGGVRWEWTGPFTEGSIRLPVVTDGNGDYTSDLGNTFVTVLTEPGSSLDIVGVGVNQFEPADAIAPPAPAGLVLTPVNGGLELQWSPVAEADLAGYIIYYSDNSFSNPHSVGVQHLRWLEGSTRLVLGGLQKRQFVAVSALDFGGNESPPTTVLSAQPLPGDPGKLSLSVNGVSGGINTPLTLTATGAAIYDWDLDGDGVFEITGDLTGSRQAYTGQSGVIRPRVRSRDGSGTAVALGSVSLLIIGNNRPVASATADPQSGPAPLSVQFTGIAEDLEDDLSALTFAWDFNGDGIYENGTDLLEPALQQYGIDGTWNAKFRVTDSEGAWDVDSVAVTVGPGLGGWPTAVLTASPERGEKGVPFRFDASASSDPGASIANYHWDIDGDGLFNENGNGEDTFEGLPEIMLSWPESGAYPVSVRVFDADGNSSDTTVMATVAGWRITPLNLSFEPVTDIAMIEVHGRPAVFCYSNDNDDMLYIRADDAVGGSWPVTGVLIDTDSYVRGRQSALMVDGRPAIAYQDTNVTGLSFVRAADSSGSSWGSSVVIDPAATSGLSVCGLTVSGRPAFCYRNGSKLSYIRATAADGTSWGAPVDVDTADSPGNSSSMAIVNGHPAISYLLTNGLDLAYVRALDETGSAWGSRSVIDTTNDTGYYSSLAVVQGAPAIAYYRTTGSVLLYVRATDPDGDFWGSIREVQSASNAGRYCFLTVYDGLPRIIHEDSTRKAVMLCEAEGLTGSSWADPVSVDDSVDAGGGIAVIELDGRQAICYYDSDIFNLRFALQY
ncbi:PKD domain-containing protein [bacterium]|nr:PKD domain-containing protein [bacterium]